MSRLIWDADGERLYETGVDRVVLYKMDAQGNYLTGEAWNGVTGITESPEGADANDIYADNIKYLSMISKENWKGTIKAYTWPEGFNSCMGNYKKGLAAYFGQQSRSKFALSWRSLLGNDTVGDKFAYKLHLAWGLSAAPSEQDHATQNDSPEAQEFSWEISSVPPQPTKKIKMGGGLSPVETEIQPCSHVFVASKIIIPGQSQPYDNSSLLTTMENKLYGTDNTTAQIYTLNDLITMLRGE